MGDTLTAYMPMKTYSATLLLCGLLCLTIASAHRCGCSRQRRAHDSSRPEAFWPSDDFDFFSSSTINNLATLRKNAALGQRALGTPRMYSHEVYTDSTGKLEETTKRQLGTRAVVERKQGTKINRELENIDETELPQFDREWRGEVPTREIAQPNEKAAQKIAQPKKPGLSCKKQHYPNGSPAEVMLLGPGERQSDHWTPVRVKGMTCDGRYELLTPAGEPVQPALDTGIEDKHLRRVQRMSDEEAVGDAMQRRLAAAEKAVEDAKQAVASEKRAKKSEQQKMVNEANKKVAMKRLAQIDATLQAAKEAQQESAKRVTAALAEKATTQEYIEKLSHD